MKGQQEAKDDKEVMRLARIDEMRREEQEALRQENNEINRLSTQIKSKHHKKHHHANQEDASTLNQPGEPINQESFERRQAFQDQERRLQPIPQQQ